MDKITLFFLTFTVKLIVLFIFEYLTTQDSNVSTAFAISSGFIFTYASSTSVSNTIFIFLYLVYYLIEL